MSWLNAKAFFKKYVKVDSLLRIFSVHIMKIMTCIIFVLCFCEMLSILKGMFSIQNETSQIKHQTLNSIENIAVVEDSEENSNVIYSSQKYDVRSYIENDKANV